MLKNAKDEYHEEAEEIANYMAIEALAEVVGDKDTAKIAKDIRREEERMLKSLEKLIHSSRRPWHRRTSRRGAPTSSRQAAAEPVARLGQLRRAARQRCARAAAVARRRRGHVVAHEHHGQPHPLAQEEQRARGSSRVGSGLRLSLPTRQPARPGGRSRTPPAPRRRTPTRRPVVGGVPAGEAGRDGRAVHRAGAGPRRRSAGTRSRGGSRARRPADRAAARRVRDRRLEPADHPALQPDRTMRAFHASRISRSTPWARQMASRVAVLPLPTRDHVLGEQLLAQVLAGAEEERQVARLVAVRAAHALR